MQNKSVAIIIPCYNASGFILDTLSSILNQRVSDLEIIIVNDGSTDDSEEKILSLNDSRIKYFKQANAGVSAARNYGFSLSSAEYTIFFDADDLMTENFILSRLNNIGTLDFICGQVKKLLNNKVNEIDFYRGTNANPLYDILLLDKTVATCPSNYMFKSEFLNKHHLKFNSLLSSTSDKYFLIQCGYAGKSDFIEECAPLLYRINENSMSHLLSDTLVLDNEAYYDLLIKNNLVPTEIKNKSLFLGFYMLAGANKKNKNMARAFKYSLMAFSKGPFAFLKKILSTH